MKRNSVLLMIGLAMLIFPGAAALTGQSPEPAAFFPDIVAWQKKGVVETFSPDTLYEYINGAAENFLNYDFKQLAVQNYASDQGQTVSAEIYFHGSEENAFGIYSSEKPIVGNYFELGSQGYAEAGILNFVCSAFYVKLSGFELGQNGQDILKVLGQAIAGKIGTPASLPKILRAFPDAGKIPNSERFFLNNFLGHDFLHNAYTADYQVNGQNFQLFIISSGSEEKARAMLKRYAALDKGKTAQNIQPGSLIINDPYNGPIHLFWSGKFICGSNNQTAAALLEELAGKLKH